MVKRDSTNDNLKIIDKRQKSREWKLNNKERVSQYNKQYYNKNRDSEIQRARNYRLNNIKKYNQWSRERTLYFKNIIYDILGRSCAICGYYEDIKCLQLDHIHGNGRKQRSNKSVRNFYCYYASNLDKIKTDLQLLCINCNWLKRLQDAQERLKNNPTILKQTKLRIYHRTYSKIWLQKQRDQLFKILGGSICIKCGQNNIRLLQIDHIKDDGNNDRKKHSDNYSLISYYLKNPEIARQKLQVLCAMCNWKKMLLNKT